MASEKTLIKRQDRESKKAHVVAQNIIVRPARLETTDISTWRTAVNNFKVGSRLKLYDLYDNIMGDPFLFDAVDKLIGSVTNAEIIFQKDKQSVEAIDDMIDTPEFEKFIKEIAYSDIVGKSVIDTIFSPEFDIFSFPRKNILIKGVDKALKDRQRFIIEKETDQSGYDYTKDPYIIECGDDNDMGLLYRAAPYVIYKRGGFGDWAQFVELFGMPFRTAKYNSYDTDTRDKLLDFLSKMGGAPYAAIPKEAEFDLKFGNGGSGMTYKEFRAACNEEILIALLGNTMTTIDGSSRSQAEVHKESLEAKVSALRRRVQRVLNRKFVPLLLQRGYDVAGGFFSFPDAGESISTEKRIEIGLQLKNAGIPVDDDYFYEVSGIPRSDTNDSKKDQQKDEKENTEKAKEETAKNDKEEKPGQEEIKNDDRNFFLKLMDRFFVYAPTFRSGANQSFGAKLKRSITGRINLADNYSIDIDKLINKALREVYDNKGEELVNKNLFDITNNALQHGIDTSLTIQDADEDFIKQFKENAAVFAAFKNHQQTKEIAALLYDADGNLVPFYKFKKEALKLSKDYNINWLQTEYNTAVRAARMAANMKQYERTAHLYPNLEYIETNAAHPRDSHLMYVGTILPIGHEWWRTHLPPSDWNCDCSVRPTRKEATPVPPDYGGINPIFANNPAQTAEFINTKETPYYKHTDESLRDSVTAEGKRLQKEAEAEAIETYTGKKGGYLEIQRQQGNERDKNLTTYKILADRGEKYTLLRPSVVEGVKNPDAFNLTNGFYSDAKHPVTSFGKNAIQTSIKEASAQGVNEVIIRFEKEYSSRSVYEGLKAAFQRGRAKRIERVIIIPKGKEPVYFEVSALRKYFYKK